MDERTPPNFFSGKEQLTPAIPQAHVLRRAFELLELDGIYCAQNVPLIYFKEVRDITPELAYRLHSQFWNHGGAPILVLVCSPPTTMAISTIASTRTGLPMRRSIPALAWTAPDTLIASIWAIPRLLARR